jgi:iron complex transport system ATP-binding protein
MNEMVLRATRLAVGYRRRSRRTPVLAGLNLAVAPGELVAVLGANGIGKSTLLRTLAGLEHPLAGTLQVGGRDFDRLAAAERARLVGIVLSERIWVGALPGRQMVALGRYAHSGWNGRLAPKDLAIVDWAIDAVGAAHLADRDCRELSDGERQKLNLARVLAQEPALIVLDEPTAFLDVTARADLMALLRQLTRDTGVAVVASTHDLDLALRDTDTAWVIGPDKRLVAGAPEDLAARGILAAAFPSRRSPDAADDSNRRRVHISGPAAAVALATTALQRERFRAAADKSDAELAIIMLAEDGRWRADHRGSEVTGASYAALAAFARQAFTAADADAVPPAARQSGAR